MSTLAAAHVGLSLGLHWVMIPPSFGPALQPNLCYEWWCARAAPSPLPSIVTAGEYARFFVATAAAIAKLSDKRARVGAAPLAPGGCVQCGCCGSANCGTADKPGATGLDFMAQMMEAVPTVFQSAHFLASHSYVLQFPAQTRALFFTQSSMSDFHVYVYCESDHLKSFSSFVANSEAAAVVTTTSELICLVTLQTAVLVMMQILCPGL